MDGIDKMSDDQLFAKIMELEKSAKSPEAVVMKTPTPEEIDKMSDDQLFAKIMELEKSVKPPEGVNSETEKPINYVKETIGGVEFNVEQANPAQNYDPDEVMTALTSYSEGYLGGFGGEAAGVVGGGLEWAVLSEDHSLADLAAFYRKNRDTYDTVRLKGLEKHPWLAFGSEVFGGGASMAKLAKLGLVGSNTIKEGMVIGGITGFGKGEGFDVGSIAGGAVLGGVLQPITNKLLGKTRGRMAPEDIAEREADAVLDGLNINATGDRTITDAYTTASSRLARRGMNIWEFADEVKMTPQQVPLFEPRDTFPKVLRKAETALGISAAGMNETAAAADRLIAGNLEAGVSVSKLMNRMETGIAPGLVSMAKDTQKRVLGALKSVAGKTHLTFTEASKLKSEITHVIKQGKNALNNGESLRWAAGNIFRDEIEAGMRVVSPELAEQYIARARAYGNWKLTTELLKTPSLAGDRGLPVAAVRTKLFNMMRRGVQAAMLRLRGGTAGAVADGIATAISDHPAHAAGKSLQSLAKIARGLKEQPGRYQDLGFRLIEASGRTLPFFVGELGYAESVMDLHASPIQRNTQDLIQKLPQALNVVNDISPDHSRKLLEAVQSGRESQIGEIMSELGRMQAAQDLIVKGTGWGGKAATAQDVRDWEAQIRQSPQNNTVKMRQLEDLRKFGNGPVFEEKTDYIRQTIISKRRNGRKVTGL